MKSMSHITISNVATKWQTTTKICHSLLLFRAPQWAPPSVHPNPPCSHTAWQWTNDAARTGTTMVEVTKTQDEEATAQGQHDQDTWGQQQWGNNDMHEDNNEAAPTWNDNTTRIWHAMTMKRWWWHMQRWQQGNMAQQQHNANVDQQHSLYHPFTIPLPSPFPLPSSFPLPSAWSLASNVFK